MPEAPEVPIEHVTEHIHHEAKHGDGPRWTMGVALSSALLAGLAAISSLLAGFHANEALIDNIGSANKWAQYQSKSLKKNIVESKVELLEVLGKMADPKEKDRIARYDVEMKEIQTEAEGLQNHAKAHLHKHEVFARAVTMFQVAIAVAAIAVLVKNPLFWFVGLGFGAIGAVFTVMGWLAH